MPLHIQYELYVHYIRAPAIYDHNLPFHVCFILTCYRSLFALQ